MNLDYEPPCKVCGHWPEDCICPECEVCGEKGDPFCYDDLKGHGMGHGLEQSAAQKVERQRYLVKCALEAYREELQILDYLLDQVSSRDN